MPKVIGIVGSRRRNTPEDFCLVQEIFCQVYKQGDKITSGMCKTGGDQFAVLLSDVWDAVPIWFWPDWKRFGRGAGIQRNGLIAATADVLIACVAFDRTGGTEDTIKKFLKLGKKSLFVV